MEYDSHNRMTAAIAFKLQAIVSDTTTVGEIIDTEGYESLEYLIETGTLTDGDYQVLLQEGDDSGLSDAATLPTVDTIGPLPVFDEDTDDDKILRVGSVGKKRYQRLSIVSTNFASAGVLMIGAQAVLGHAKHLPTAAQAT